TDRHRFLQYRGHRIERDRRVYQQGGPSHRLNDCIGREPPAKPSVLRYAEVQREPLKPSLFFTTPNQLNLDHQPLAMQRLHSPKTLVKALQPLQPPHRPPPARRPAIGLISQCVEVQSAM